MTYEEYLDKYSKEINSGNFSKLYNRHFEFVQGLEDSSNWPRLVEGLIKLGQNPLANMYEVPVDFFRMVNLKEIIIPSNIIKIGSSAFAYCKNLTQVTIPTSVIKLGSQIAEECDNLKTIVYLGTMEQWSKIYKEDWDLFTNITKVKCSDGYFILEFGRSEKWIQKPLKNT